MLVAFLAIAMGIARGVDSQSRSAGDAFFGVTVPFVVLTAALIAVCWKTGEKPEWRWGGKPLWKKRQ